MIRGMLEEAALDELVESATLLVSETVTNAVLHAGTRIELECRVQRGVVCVEVRDGSPVLPGRRRYAEDAMTGRGLGMVELLADDWGVEVTPDGGKSVWFVLAPAAADTTDLPARGSAAASDAEPEQVLVRLYNAPPALLATTVQYGDSLLRELVLSSLDDADAEGMRSWGGSHIDLAPVLDAVDRKATDRAEPVDVEVRLPAGSGTAAFERLALVEEADRLARSGKLLTVPELPEVSACRRWLLGEIAAQEEGAEPTAWELPAPPPPDGDVAALSAAERRRIDELGTAAVVADEANRILHVNAEAAQLLGYAVDELVDQRLITIVPHRLREAHLAGFGRYLLTREPHLLDRRIEIPVLTADGTETAVAATIRLLDAGEGPMAFLATFEPR